MSKVFSVLLLLSIVALTSAFTIQQQKGAIPWPYTNCGSGPWTFKNFTLSATPSRNIVDQIVMVGVADDHIEFDHVDIDVKLNGLPLHTQTDKYQNTFDSGDVIQYKFNNLIPSFAPSGTYLLTFNFKDSGNSNLGCFSFSFKL